MVQAGAFTYHACYLLFQENNRSKESICPTEKWQLISDILTTLEP